MSCSKCETCCPSCCECHADGFAGGVAHVAADRDRLAAECERLTKERDAYKRLDLAGTLDEMTTALAACREDLAKQRRVIEEKDARIATLEAKSAESAESEAKEKT